MPYRWLSDGPTPHLHLWPHRSLTQAGFARFTGLTAAAFALPLAALLGTPALWAVLGFGLLVFASIWTALRRNAADRSVTEDLALAPGRVLLVRSGPRERRREWQADPRGVRVILHPKAGPVPQYLTLQGGPREVELGAFLTPGERVALAAELRAALAGLR